MTTDIVSPHNNVISFQIWPCQGGQAAGEGDAGLHASAVRLPGWGQAGFTGVVRRAPGEGRQRHSPVAADKQIKSKRVAGHQAPIHLSLCPPNKYLSPIYSVPSSVLGGGWQGGDLSQPGPSRRAHRRDDILLAWETRQGREIQPGSGPGRAAGAGWGLLVQAEGHWASH